MKETYREIQTTKVLGPNQEIIPESLDDIIKNIKEMVFQRDFVEGSKVFINVRPAVKGMLNSACLATTELLNKGSANGGIDTDKYNLLTAKTKSFNNKNGVVNKMLAELAEERLLAEQTKPQDENAEPLSDEEKAKLLAEPTEDVDTHKADITTKDDGRFTFDKKNFKLTLHFNDGTTRELTLAPEGTWRNTALNWICKFFKSIKDGVVKTAKTIGGFFSRLNPFKLKKDERVPTGWDEEGNPIYDPVPPKEKKIEDKGENLKPATT